MSWKVRHEGSPQHIELASAQEVMQGLVDGVWEPADEVRGPDDANWMALENHPLFAEAAADIEPLPQMHPDESKLDMTALIDVCLVLLIFYILTTSYTQLQAAIENPHLAGDVEGPPAIDDKQIHDTMIRVTVKLDKQDKPVIRVEDKVVEERLLVAEFRKLSGPPPHKNTLLLVFDGDVRNKTLTTIEDSAKQAGIEYINWGVK
jgi:biopolymer transport protein ExbD